MLSFIENAGMTLHKKKGTKKWPDVKERQQRKRQKKDDAGSIYEALLEVTF
jgi:hypothetical protein